MDAVLICIVIYCRSRQVTVALFVEIVVTRCVKRLVGAQSLQYGTPDLLSAK